MYKDRFKQGMSTEDADSHDLGLDFLNAKVGNIGNDGKDPYDRFLESYTNLSNRPDWDGYLTKEEADDWWKTKSGIPLFVDQSKINLKGVDISDFEKSNPMYHNFIWDFDFDNPYSNLSETGRVYGSIKLTLLNNQGDVMLGRSYDFLDEYDFEMDDRVFRNIATWVGRPGGPDDGKSFIIKSYGHAKLN